MSYKPLEEALNEFYQDCTIGHSVQSKSPNTIKNVAATWTLFLQVTPIEYCGQITEGALRRFFEWGHTKRKWQAMTNRSHRKNLSVFIKWAERKKYMGKNPLEQIPPPRLPQRVPKHHTLKEIEAMFDSIALLSLTQFEEARNKAIVGVGALAGLRRGELINLKLSDVNMESKQLLVKAETSKSRKERWVPIVHRLDNLLQDYLRLRGQRAEDSCHALWVSSVTGKPLTTHGLAHIVGKVSDDVGFKVNYTHCGTHTEHIPMQALTI
jgi:site-specific recombinase XerD